MMSSSPSLSLPHSTRLPLKKTPFKLRSSSTRTPLAWRTTIAWRRDTVGSSKRMSAVRLRPILVHSPINGMTEIRSPCLYAR